MLEKIARYRKALVASAPAALSILAEFVGVDSPLYVKVVAVLVAVGVYAVPNKSATPEV
jgi:hypothetical protein